jgi:hypothetical protein
VIGSLNEDFVSGTTDLRGVFVADGVRGVPTVIAEMTPGRYAFFRGQAGGGGQPIAVVAAPRTNPPAVATPNDAPSPQTDPSAGISLLEESAAEQKIRETLDSPTTIDFIDMPLTDAVAYLKDQHKIEIQLDQKALDEVGIAADQAINRNLTGITLRSALRLILRDMDLTYLIRDDVLLITTPDRAAENLVRLVYPVEDLVRYVDEEGQPLDDYDSLIEMLTTTVDPTSWDEVGGPGSVAVFEMSRSLVISQTQEVHEEISQMFQTLRRIREQVGPPPKRRPAPSMQGGAGGAMGGMGGMGGGMGMGGFGGPAPAAAAPAGEATAPAPSAGEQNADLLGGLRESNQQFQRQNVEQLKGMYKSGMGMGGMGGVDAGAINRGK